MTKEQQEIAIKLWLKTNKPSTTIPKSYKNSKRTIRNAYIAELEYWERLKS